MVLQLIFTGWLQALEWLKPLLCLPFLSTHSTVRAADALQTALKTDPVPQKSLKAEEDSQGSQNTMFCCIRHESPTFISFCCLYTSCFPHTTCLYLLLLNGKASVADEQLRASLFPLIL